MKTHTIKAASWFVTLPHDHARISISRSAPRGQGAGYRIYKKLAPGAWFNSVGPDEYDHLYRVEILGPLDPRAVAAEVDELALGRIPTLLCFEVAGKGQWCHRSMAARWLADALGQAVPEFGYEDTAQEAHPLLPAMVAK
jgi:hypothetical protein